MFCSADDPRQVCVERREAVMRGRFFYAINADAWVWKDARTNPWYECPWCNAPLPSLENVAERLMDGTVGYDEEGEE